MKPVCGICEPGLYKVIRDVRFMSIRPNEYITNDWFTHTRMFKWHKFPAGSFVQILAVFPEQIENKNMVYLPIHYVGQFGLGYALAEKYFPNEASKATLSESDEQPCFERMVKQ